MKLLIFGMGEMAQLAHFYFAESGDWEIVGFAADPQFLGDGKSLAGLPTVAFGAATRQFSPKSHCAFVAVSAGDLNHSREDMCQRVEALGYELVSFVHPSTTVASNVEIGRNTFVFEDNTLQPFTKVGNRCILWSGNHIGHRTVIEDDVFVASHVVISGYCRIGRYSYLGVNSSVADGVNVATETVLGAAALLLADNEPSGIYVGSPARRLPNRNSREVRL